MNKRYGEYEQVNGASRMILMQENNDELGPTD